MLEEDLFAFAHYLRVYAMLQQVAVVLLVDLAQLQDMLLVLTKGRSFEEGRIRVWRLGQLRHFELALLQVAFDQVLNARDLDIGIGRMFVALVQIQSMVVLLDLLIRP